jgi:hypothetical protein
MPREEAANKTGAATEAKPEETKTAKAETKEKKIPFVVVSAIKKLDTKKGQGDSGLALPGETVMLTKTEAKAFGEAVRPKTAMDEEEKSE